MKSHPHAWACFVLSACLASNLFAPRLLAQAPPTNPLSQPTRATAPVPTSQPPVQATSGAESETDQAPASPRSKPSAAEHLQRAIEHLAAAGRTDLAQRVRKELELAEKKRQLNLKLQQLAELQAEVDALRRATGSAQNVVLHVRVMEFQTELMRKMGFDFQAAPGGEHGSSEDALMAVIRSGKHAGLLDALRSHQLVKVLAEPTLSTVSGRPVSFQSGGEFPIVVPQGVGQVGVEFRSFGTRLDCIPIVLGNGKIRLELRPVISEIDASKSVRIGENVVPGLRTRHFDAAVELTAGETLVLAGPTRAKSTEEGGTPESSLIFTVRAELTQSQAARKPRPSRVR